MFHEAVGDEDVAVEAAALLSAFETMLSETVSEKGAGHVVDEARVDEHDVEAIANGSVGDLTVEEGASVLAVGRDLDADAIVFELRDHLLMGMTTAVLDVDTIAGAIDSDLTGQEIQQAIEGRAAMTVAQLAEIMAVIERRKR
ncbi:DUF5791 family protein [Halorubrum sp. DTA98]|uniref:DUF5791 family protein n=1 Tax=Halorubrum sp. DTA98 TaxID=3402163 RepID=UPI003AAE5306